MATKTEIEDDKKKAAAKAKTDKALQGQVYVWSLATAQVRA